MTLESDLVGRIIALERRLAEIEARENAAISTKFGGNAYRNTNQTIPTGTWTRVILNATRFDIYPSGYSAHFDSTNGYFVIRKSGYYIITATQAFASNSSGNRAIAISRNGSIDNAIVSPSMPNVGSSTATLTATTIEYLADGDTLELWVYQNSGDNLDIVYSVPSWSKLAFWLLFA